MRTSKHEVVERFLNDVNEQIQYQAIHAAINEELCAHIEDKAEMYMDFGLDEKIACEKAVRDMGDPSALGMQLNEAHHLRIAKPLLLLLTILTILGFLGNIADGGLLYIIDSTYYIWGMGVLLVTMLWGYPVLLKYTDKILAVLFSGCILYFVFLLLRRYSDLSSIPHMFFSIYSTSLRYGILQISIPSITVLLFRNRRTGIKSLLTVFSYEAFMIISARLTIMSGTAYIPLITMMISCTGIMLYMLAKEYFSMEKIKGTAITVTGTVLLIALFCGIQWNDVSTNLQMFINPNARASVTDAWDDSYNNVLIRELLGRAELFGEVQISEEERIRYKTSQWYYEDGEGNWDSGTEGWRTLEDHVRYKMQFADELEIEDILPQHYLNNYRIAYWILKYGLIPGMVLLSLIIIAQILMFRTSFKIRNRLGRLVAIAGSLAFAVQNSFYILGNFGFQFGKFGNLPFVSEGWASITGTMIMAGIMLSAYRFDTVIRERL